MANRDIELGDGIEHEQSKNLKRDMLEKGSLYIGMYDDLGLERILPIEEDKGQSDYWLLRMRFNNHRNVKAFRVLLYDKDYKKIQALMDRGLSILALNYLRSTCIDTPSPRREDD